MAARDTAPVPGAQFEETLASASPDVLREMIKRFAQRMMDADVEVRCNAGYGEVTPRGRTRATAAGCGSRTPGPGRSNWRSRGCARARTTRSSPGTGGGPGGPWPRWSPLAACWASRPGGWRSWPPRSG